MYLSNQSVANFGLDVSESVGGSRLGCGESNRVSDWERLEVSGVRISMIDGFI